MKRSGLHHDGAGLYLQVSANRAKSWVFRFTYRGKAHTMGLGGLKQVSLAKARKLTMQAHEQLGDGINPIDAREARRATEAAERAKSVTFKSAAQTYINDHSPGWRNRKHALQWSSTLESYAFPVIGDRPVISITTDDVLKILSPIWNTKTETAKRVQARLENILDWARVKGYRNDTLNPAAWKSNLDRLLPKPSKVKKVQHHPSMPHSKVPSFMAELSKLPGVAPLALRFKTLTACRSGEVLGATWDEIDLKARVWSIPGERMKSHRQHRVPLSNAAVAVLEAVPRIDGNDYVFPGRYGSKHLSGMALLQTMRRLGYGPGGKRGPYVPHGMRSSFRDWCSEHLIPGEVAEASLAHVVANKTESAYWRSDLLEQRAELIQRWADYCQGKRGKVLKIQKGVA